MGIPSYFSYIVKNHPEILQKFITGKITVDNLYMDCNSIIYDSFYKLTNEEKEKNIPKTLIKNVINKINEYISIINPVNTVIIAFDGVAPMAKLEQQRTRRYKSWFQSKITNSIFNKNEETWNTTSITPGTAFMKQLNKEITEYFENVVITPKIIVSTTDEPGEGEHKIFQYIRENEVSHTQQKTVIYGLDADLIMLSINHLPICKHIYLFRETPEFIKSINKDLEPDQNYILDIPQLANNIIIEMMDGTNITSDNQNKRIYDYIFLCFFLGNDFLPHFPSLNIRTGGIDKLISHYRNTLGKTNKFIIQNNKIVWKNLRTLFTSISLCEKEYISNEILHRNKLEKRFFNQKIDTPEQKYESFQNIPCYERTIEKHIHPDDEFWRHKYYSTLFNIEPEPDRIKQLCINYLEGLEWTFKYYNTSCPDWNWTYNYHYPPLIQDLLVHIPYFDTIFIRPNNSSPISQKMQLCYVLPRKSLNLLPYKIYTKLLSTCPEYYPEYCDFNWSFCRYFWESHPQLPDINLKTIYNIIEKS